MRDLTYHINKGINRPIEFRGLKGQYVYYLAIGLVILLVDFAFLYICGLPVSLCVVITGLAGSGLFFCTYRYSHRYGEHGLMKALAFRQVTDAIKNRSRNIFKELAK